MRSPNQILRWLERLGQHERLLLALVAFGVLLRLLAYISNPSIWLDEAMLLRSVMGHDYRVLLGTLEYDQSGPVLFLAATKFLADLTAGNGFAVRLLSCLAGCALMPLGLVAAKRLLPRAAIAPALLLLAVSDPLIDFSAQAKPYAIDALLTLAAVYCGHRVAQGDDRPAHRFILGAIAVCAPWLSWGTCFALAAVFAVVFLSPAVFRSPRRLASWTPVVVLWLAGGVAIALMSRQWSTMDSIEISWIRKDAFAPFPPTSLAELRWYPRQLLRAMEMPGGFMLREVGALLALLGIVALIKWRSWRLLWLFCVPILLAAAASAAHLYPFRTRLLLYSGPLLTFLAALGLVSLVGSPSKPLAPRAWRQALAGVFLILALLSLGFETGRALYHVAEPRVRGQMREMAAFLTEHCRPDDLIYVYYAAVPSFEFYLPSPPCRIRYSIQARYERERYAEDIDRLRGEDNLWVVFSRTYEDRQGNEETLMTGLLDDVGRRIAYHPYQHGGIYQYDLRASDR